VHGSGTTDLRTWGAQIEPFAEHFRVIAYSQRYHYPNAWIGDGSDINSTSVHAGDLAALIASLQLGRVHLIGVSYGADIVLRLAVDHPQLVRTLVITEPGLFSWLVTLPEGPKLFAEYAEMMIPAKQAVKDGDLERGMRLYLDSFMGSGVFDQLPASVRGRIMDNLRLLTYEPTKIGEMGPDITREEAAAIQTPTLLLTGEESPKMFLLVSQELARYLQNAEQAQIGEASHLLHVMNPQVYNATVLAFLARHAG
jgi:pimeloyl-ACP methyl ester carboxylesterase